MKHSTARLRKPALMTGLMAVIVVSILSLKSQWEDVVTQSLIEEHLGAVIFIVLIIIAVFLNLVFGGRCPKCGERRALDKTGNVEKRSWLEADREEWKCVYCGHKEWKKKHHDSGAGG